MSWGQIFFALAALLIAMGGLVMAHARTRPKEAVSALSEWAEFYGIKRVPIWLQNKEADDVAQKWARIVVFISLVAIILGAAVWYSESIEKNTATKISGNQPPADEHVIPFADQEVHGELIPANDPTPPNSCDQRSVSPDTVKVLLGNNVVGTAQFGKYPVLQIGTCEAISLDRTVDGVFFNAQLQDEDDNSVIRIVRNKIDALNGENSVARQSRDKASITVTNKKGMILFYARFLNRATIRVRGFFGCERRNTMLIQDDLPLAGMFSHSCFLNGRGGVSIGD